MKYNEFGEVISVNGITTGQHLGTPMQDAKPKKAEDNELYSEERGTVTKTYNMVDDKQPEVSGNTGGGSSSGGSYFALMIYDGNKFQIDGQEFKITPDFMNDLQVLSDNDFETFFGILQKKIAIELSDVARIWHCEYVEYNDNLEPWCVTLADTAGFQGTYTFCSRSYQQSIGF